MIPEDPASVDSLSAEDRELLAQELAAHAVTSGPILRTADVGPAPLSFAQRQLWVFDQVSPGDPAYHLSVAFRAVGRLDLDALTRAIDALIERHEILRTTFEMAGDEPRQRVHPPAPVALAVTDLTDADEATAVVIAAEEARAPFDLGRGPLFRARVLRLGPEQHVLILTMHHIVSDGWSMNVLFRELGAWYDAERRGCRATLPELSVQYHDVARWQHAWLRGEALDRLVGYWRRQLDGAVSLRLPLDRPAAAGSDGQEQCRIDPRELRAVDALARKERATRFMTMLATFMALLARYAGTGDVMVGSPLAGRDRTEVAPLVGLFVNLLPFRTRVDARTTFRELLRQVRDTTLGAYEHQDLPFDRLVEELGIEKPASGNPLFDVTFSAQDLLAQPLELAGLRLEPLDVPATRARFDLEAHVLGDPADPSAVRVGLVYRASRFEADAVRRMLGHYVALLRACAASPDRPLEELSLLSEAERTEILVRWNQTACVHEQTERIPVLIAGHAARSPGAIALKASGEQLTYGELDRRASQWAQWMRRKGIGAEAAVGVLFDRSIDLAVALLAVLKAGAAYLPLDPAYPPDRLAHMLADAGVALVLTAERHRRALSDFAGLIACLDTDRDVLRGMPDVAPDVAVEADQLAYIIYTSGSTGTPKGVAVPHAGLENLVHWHRRVFAVSAADRATLVASVGFDASAWELWPYLAAGASVHIVDDEARSMPERLWSWLGRERISIAFLPTPLAEAALRDGVPAGVHLRWLLTGGDRLTTSRKEEWRFAFVNNYGPTENAVVSTSGLVDAGPDAARLPSIGRPIDNVRAYVLDTRMVPQPIGIDGELYVGGASLARGYLGRPAQTAERFVPDPFSGAPGARLYRTGDLVRWRRDGTLEFVGRRDNQVKIRGFRIELGEVEAALARLPGVHTAVAVVRHVGDEGRLVGYLVPDAGVDLEPEALRERLKRQLPAYMVPGALVAISELPLTAHGKVDRGALPDPPRPEAAQRTDRPTTRVEAALACIWAEVLRLDRVGIHDNFFDVGGDSVLSIQIASRASRAGIRLTPKQFFVHQTIAELAVTVADEDSAPGGPQDRATGVVPLTPIQRWYFDQDHPHPQHFCQSVLLDAAEGVTPAAVRSALASLVSHHDVLRSRFRRGRTGWTQEIVGEDLAVPLVEMDLAAVPDGERRAAIDRVADDLQRDLCLQDGVLVQTAWLKPAHGRNQLLLVIHHLVVDVVSWRILLEDLQTAVEAVRAARPVVLPPKTTSFLRWARILQDHARSSACDADRIFWQRHAAPAGARLPPDHAVDRRENTVGRSARVAAALSREETDALLREVSRASGARPNEVLLAAVVHALRGWTASDTIRLDVEGHGRYDGFPGVDLSRTVGWFTAVYPLTIEVPAGGGVWDIVEQVRETVRAVPLDGQGYGLLRDTLPGAPSEVSFNYIGQIDRSVPVAGPFTLAAGSAGSEMSPRNRRPYLIDVVGRVANERLELSWTYCPAIHERSTLERLAAQALDAVRAVIADAARMPKADGARTFPLAGLEKQRLAGIVSRFAGHSIEDIYPLTPLQHGMLVHSLARPGSGAFITQIELVLEGALDAKAFAEAWRRLQRRHPVLRTACSEAGGGEFRQVVVSNAPLPWAERDWSREPEAEAHRRLQALLEEERRRGFGLDEAPMMRLALVELRTGRFHLVWTHHHLLLDGWSVVMLLEELVHLYEGGRDGRDVPAEPRPGYREYLEWLRKRPAGASEPFWRRFLEGFTSPTILSVDRAPHVRTHAADRIVEQERWIDPALTRALAETAARHRVTLNTVMQGAWALLLSRYSGQSDVVFGTAVAGRPVDLSGMERMVGLFLNGLPMRVIVDDAEPADRWLASIQRDHVEVRQHEHDALASIQGWSDVPPGQPIFETTVAFENYPVAEGLGTATRRMGIVDFRLTANTSAALHLRVVPGERLRLMLSHDRGRFDEATAREMLRQLERIARQFVEHPGRPVGEISLASDGANEAGAGPSAPEWTRGAVHVQILARARLDPERQAIAFEGIAVSYRELDERSARVAAALRAAGVTRGQVVGVYAPRGADLVIGLLAVLRTGGAFMILDPAYPPARLSQYLAGADVRFVLHAGGRADAPDVLVEWAGPASARTLVTLDAAVQMAGDEHVCESAGPDDLAYVAFTSGSTGEPKAVLGRHAALAHYAHWLRERFGLDASDRVSMLSALSHDPLLRDVFPPLQLGATLCIPGADRFDRPGALMAWMTAAGVTSTNLTPAMAQLLLEGGDDARVERLRLAFFVGEPLPLAVVERLRRRAPSMTCVNLYGATETQQALGHFVLPDADVDCVHGIVPVGSGIPGAELLVRCASGISAGIGEVGEIWMRSPLLARGYLGDPDLTAARFVDDPFGRGTGRAYRTGDRGRVLPGGAVAVLGRDDTLVKIRGFRVAPGEIEAYLQQQPDVHEAAVTVGRDRASQAVINAFVTGPGAPSELRQRMRTQFPEYMVPARLTVLDRLPRTATGKIDRLALARRVIDGPDRQDAYVAPRTPAEERLAAIWADLLGVDRVGVFDDFFALGGHSIVAARLVARIRDTLGVDVRIADVFERPRIAEFGELVAAAAVEEDEIVRRLAGEIRNLSAEELQALLEDAGLSGGGPAR